MKLGIFRIHCLCLSNVESQNDIALGLLTMCLKLFRWEYLYLRNILAVWTLLLFLFAFLLAFSSSFFPFVSSSPILFFLCLGTQLILVTAEWWEYESEQNIHTYHCLYIIIMCVDILYFKNRLGSKSYKEYCYFSLFFIFTNGITCIYILSNNPNSLSISPLVMNLCCFLKILEY